MKKKGGSRQEEKGRGGRGGRGKDAGRKQPGRRRERRKGKE